MKKYLSVFTSIFFILMVQVAFAAVGPVELLETAANKMIAALKKDKLQLSANPDAVYKIVDDILFPHVDTVGMSRSVVGRTAWEQASRSDREQFEQAFTRLVVQTYSHALASYTNEQIKFYPIRGGVPQQARRVEVKSTILRANGPSISVDYRLVNKKNHWKIYDMSVEGVSLLQSFHSQFLPDLEQHDLAYLTQRLIEHNRKNKGQ